MVSSRTTSTTRISAPHAKHCITRTHRYRTKPLSGAKRGRTVKTSGQIDRGCGRGGTRLPAPDHPQNSMFQRELADSLNPRKRGPLTFRVMPHVSRRFVLAGAVLSTASLLVPLTVRRTGAAAAKATADY